MSLPQGALQYGYTQPLYTIRPTGAGDIGQDVNTSAYLYNGIYYYGVLPDMGKYSTDSSGSLSMDLGGAVSGIKHNSTAGALPLLAAGAGFHIEFQIKLNINNSDCWPACWLLPIEKNGHGGDCDPLDRAGYERWAEYDVVEGGLAPGPLSSAINWRGKYDNPITFTAAPGSGATSGTLSTSWIDDSGTYEIIFSDGSTSRQGVFVKGQTTCNWTGGVGSGLTASAKTRYSKDVYNNYPGYQGGTFDWTTWHRFGFTLDPPNSRGLYFIDDALVETRDFTGWPPIINTYNLYPIVNAATRGANVDYILTLDHIYAYVRSTKNMGRILLDDPTRTGGSSQIFVGTSGNDGTGDKARAGATSLKYWAADMNAMTNDLYNKHPGYRSIINRMRASLSSAHVKNAATVQPLNQPAAWVASTAYVAGQAVANGGNNYVCLTAGTSAASGGPTGKGAATITDGTCVWYYWGVAFTSDPAAPTLSFAAFAARYTGFYWTTTLNTYGVGGTRIYDSSNFLFYGSAGTDGAGTNGSYKWDALGLIGGVIFATDAAQFQIVLNGNASPSFALYIDDVPAALGCAVYSGGQQFYQVVLPDRRPRKITVEMQSNLIQSFFGVLMNDSSSVWAPNLTNDYRLSFVGTSYLDGSGNHPVTASLSLGSQIARRLGNGNYWIDRIGSGSGYIAGGGANKTFGDATRLAALVASNPEVVIIMGGGINDYNAAAITAVGASTPAALALEQAAALAYYQAVRAALPNALIFVFGSESGATGPSASIFNMELAVSNAVAQQQASGDNFIWFLPQSGTVAKKAWINGTGTTAATNASGNSDFLIASDSIHPVQAGVNYLAAQHANSLRAAINALTL